MTRTTHILLQAIIQAGQAFVSYPGLQLSTETMALLHAVLGGMTMVVASLSQTYNTDGTPQTVPFVPPAGTSGVKTSTTSTTTTIKPDPRGGERD